VSEPGAAPDRAGPAQGGDPPAPTRRVIAGPPRAAGASYAGSGVDIEAGERAVALMRDAVAKTAGPDVIGGIGGFAGLFDASRLAVMRRPLLATSTDGVGTKVIITQQTGCYGTIGIDLVGMVVDDLVVCGAEPLFMTDYIVCGRVTPERVAEIVGGIADGCVLAGCALIGGETAEHPGHLGPEEFDLAGAATGVVEADRLLGPGLVKAGDVVLGLASSGLHSNGFSLVRQILRDTGLDLEAEPPDLGRSLGAELATPTRIYAQHCLALASECQVHAFAHITGGGLAANTARVLPPDADALLDRASWSPPPVFGLLAGLGSVDAREMEQVFNMGVGMTAVVAAAHADKAIGVLTERGVPAWPLGEIVAGGGHATLTGRHPQPAPKGA
jgi:phosphoribosylformylglycinamidine cyclo-ligase